MIDKALLKESAALFHIEVTEDLADKLALYSHLLVEWNKKMNLTAITDPSAIVIKHFIDSLTAAAYLPNGRIRIIDVGTGAGFPGVPLALLRPDIQLTLLDSLNKRLAFLKELCTQLGLPVFLVHARAEDGGRQPQHREQYDVATARAVAALPTLCEYCLPFVKPGGCFLAMKGPDSDEEQAAAKRALSLLGGKTAAVHTLHLPSLPNGEDGGERRLILIDKIMATPAKYPRPSAKIAKQPLK